MELSDLNHVLLRRMTIEAPGTYHHSLVVAQLAENAASPIGANPLLARVCALFHDIGKTANAAYFTENQRDSVNPHGSHPAGKGTRYRATVIGPGVTPDVYWEGASPGSYDKSVDLVANDAIAQLGDKLCKAN